MNAKIGFGFAAVVGAVVFFVWYTPESRQSEPLDVPEVAQVEPTAPQTALPVRRTVLPKAVAPAVDTPPPPPQIVDAGPPEPDIGAGPWMIDLGSHTIHLRDEGMVMRVHPKVWVSSPVTRKEVARRRRSLVRMLFFLGSHRRAAGAEGVAGEARFRDDLLARFRNVVRTGQVDKLEFGHYEVVSAPAEPEDEKD